MTKQIELPATSQQIVMMAAAILGQPEGTANNRQPEWPIAVAQAERAYAALFAIAKHEEARVVGEPVALREALQIAEAALADIGDADREPGDDVAWCEARAAQALPQVRAALASPPAPQVAQAEPMREHVERFAEGAGWVKGSPEGAFEFAKSKCYSQGWQDGRREALGDVHRDTPEVAAPVAQPATEQAEAPAIECDCETATSPDGARSTRCGSDQMRRAVSEGHAFVKAATKREIHSNRAAYLAGYEDALQAAGISVLVGDHHTPAALATKPPAGEQKPVASIYVTPGGEREFDDWKCTLPVGRNLLYPGPQPEQMTQDKEDAENYRWLCTHVIVPAPSLWDNGVGFVTPALPRKRGAMTKPELDEHIRAARARGEGGAKG